MIETITIERIYLPDIDARNAINAAADKDCRQADMAGLYADCLRAHFIHKKNGGSGVDWKAVNGAIAARWPKGLERVKKAGWKLFEEGK